jgi:hypothetical protein
MNGQRRKVSFEPAAGPSRKRGRNDDDAEVGKRGRANNNAEAGAGPWMSAPWLEKQVGQQCGKHALNNLFVDTGIKISIAEIRAAGRKVADELSAAMGAPLSENNRENVIGSASTGFEVQVLITAASEKWGDYGIDDTPRPIARVIGQSNHGLLIRKPYAYQKGDESVHYTAARLLKDGSWLEMDSIDRRMRVWTAAGLAATGFSAVATTSPRANSNRAAFNRLRAACSSPGRSVDPRGCAALPNYLGAFNRCDSPVGELVTPRLRLARNAAHAQFVARYNRLGECPGCTYDMQRLMGRPARGRPRAHTHDERMLRPRMGRINLTARTVINLTRSP